MQAWSHGDMLSRSVGTPSTAYLPPLPQRFPAPLLRIFSASLWSPLRRLSFRGLWAGGGADGQWCRPAAARLMVELTGSSFLAALVPTACWPFLLAMPAGVL